MVGHISETLGEITKVAVQTTCGDFATEDEAVAEFDRIVRSTGVFSVYREVKGRYVNGRPNVDDVQPRIDRILVPRPELVAQGWNHGSIAVECKASGQKLGRVIAQALDYSNAVFEIQPGFHIWCEWLFVWPLEKVRGDVESIMAQNRIGWCRPNQSRTAMSFGTGSQNMIRIGQDGEIQSVCSVATGKKRGSR